MTLWQGGEAIIWNPPSTEGGRPESSDDPDDEASPPPLRPGSLGARGVVLYSVEERTVGGRPGLSLKAVSGPGDEVQPRFETVLLETGLGALTSATPEPPELRSLDGVHPIVPSQARILAAEEALERARVRLAALESGEATTLRLAEARAEVAERELELRAASRLELTLSATGPISRILFDPSRTRIVRKPGDDDDGGPQEHEQKANIGPTGSPLPLSADRPDTARGIPDPTRDSAPPTSDLAGEELRDRIILVSPTAVRVLLPDGFPPGEYTLLVAFSYCEGDARRVATGSVPFTVEERA